MGEEDSPNPILYTKYQEEENTNESLIGINIWKNSRDSHSRGEENIYDGGSRGRTYL